MAGKHVLNARLAKEMRMLGTDPPFGVAVWLNDESDITSIQASIQGPDNTPYASGRFKLSIKVPDRYPFEPPGIQFDTKIYHPNIDSSGRICLDSLKMPPAGAWMPSLNLSQVLSQIRLLMITPNPDDPLMVEVCEVYKNNRQQFLSTAAKWTKEYATEVKPNIGASSNNSTAIPTSSGSKSAKRKTEGSDKTLLNDSSDESSSSDSDSSDDEQEQQQRVSSIPKLFCDQPSESVKENSSNVNKVPVASERKLKKQRIETIQR